MKRVAAVILIALVSPASLLAANWVGLEAPPAAGFDETYATAISADGSVVVGYARNSSTGATQAFRWTAANGQLRPENIGSDGVSLLAMTSTDGTAFASTTACCVSADGSIVAGTGLRSGTGSNATPLRWTINASGLDTLATVPSSFPDNQVRALSPDGAVAGGTGLGPSASCVATSNLPALWPSPGAAWDGGQLPGGANAGDVQGIATTAAIVVGDVYDACAGAGAPRQAFIWTPAGGYSLLGTLPGATSSIATVVSADGSRVAGYAGSTASTQAFVWTRSGGMTGLSAFNPATGLEVGLVPTGISADGTVMVGNNRTSTNPRFGGANVDATEVWTPSTGALNLFDVLVDNGLFTQAPFLELSNVAGISTDGTWVAGTAASLAPGFAPIAFVSYIGLSPPAPADLQVVASPTGAISLSWQPVAGITDYLIYINGSGAGRTTATTATISGLNAGETYDVSVGTESPQGQTPLSATVSVAVTPGDGQINVTWTSVPGATEYVVGISTSPGGESPATSSCQGMCGTAFAASAHAGSISNLQNGQTYYVKVFAKAVVGRPVSSAEASAIPVATSSTSGGGASGSTSGTRGAGGGGAFELLSLLTLGVLLCSRRGRGKARDRAARGCDGGC